MEKRTLSEAQVLSKLIDNREYWQEIQELRQTYELPPDGFASSIDGVQELARWHPKARKGRDPVDALSWNLSEINRRWQYPPLVDAVV